MGKYTIIADVSEKISEILAKNLVPNLVTDKNMIGFCSPEEKGDYVVGIHLYDISRDNEMAQAGMINYGLKEQKYPPTVLSLSYMLTVYSKSDLKFRFIEEQKILGAIIQSLDNEMLIPAEELGNVAYEANGRIEILNLEMEEKLRIWGDPSKAYKPSIFIKIAPVELESQQTRQISRVREFSIELVDSQE
ncbi:MAG: DUF4255 domain-containing protein [Clostridia bacterium]